MDTIRQSKILNGIRSFIVILLITVLLQAGTATAQDQSPPSGQPTVTTYAFPAEEVEEGSVQVSPLSQANVTGEDGSWTGTTNQGLPVSFTVSQSGAKWTNFKVKTSVVSPCSVTLTTTAFGPGTITNGNFGLTTSTFWFSGHFDTATTASGTYGYTNHSIPMCGSLTMTGTWTATVPIVMDRDSAGVFRPSNGIIFLKNRNKDGFADIALNYGLAGDKPVVGDWDDNGTTTIGVYRAGKFYLRNSNTNGFADLIFALGIPGDMPIAGDWDGDGDETVGVFRPSNGVIFLKNTNTPGFADVALNYGLGGDYPVTGDWDGDGDDTIGVYRGNTFLLRQSNSVGFADLNFVFGQVGDQPIAGDWNDDGIDTIGVFRPSTAQFLLRNSNSAGLPDKTFYLGNVGDVGIAGDWDNLP